MATVLEPPCPLTAVTERPAAGPLAPYEGQTYYNLPAVKGAHYGWLISGYFFVGGLAGFAQILAALADLRGEKYRNVVRAGRYLALAGATISPILLIADLYTPQRWYNMLRLFRKTSAMSIGAWTLTAFGTFSGLAAVGQLADDVYGSKSARWLARLCGLPAALAGALMSVYTGTLLASTSTPLWLAVPRLLPALFGASAASTSAAAVSLTLHATGASEEETRPVETFGILAEITEGVLLQATQAVWKQKQLDEPLKQEPLVAALTVAAVGLGLAVPLALHTAQALSGRRSKLVSSLAAVSTLLGGLALRSAILFAGNPGNRPQDYFRLTQREE